MRQSRGDKVELRMIAVNRLFRKWRQNIDDATQIICSSIVVKEQLFALSFPQRTHHVSFYNDRTCHGLLPVFWCLSERTTTEHFKSTCIFMAD